MSQDKIAQVMEFMKKSKMMKNDLPEIITASDLPPVDWVHTGILRLDWAWGGGAPRGHCIELFGPERGGKTTTALRIIAAAQAIGLVCAFVDCEHTLDLVWARTLGVDTDRLLYINPIGKSAEYILEMIQMMIASGGVDILVFDSVAALASEAELKGTMEDSTYCGISNIMARFCDKVIYSGLLKRTNSILIGINQIRDNVGVQYGKRTKTPGGRSWKHACSIRTEITKGDYITTGSGASEDRIGQQVNFFIEKNKVRKPFKSGLYKLYFSAGINPLSDVIEMSKEYQDDLPNHRWAGAYLYYRTDEGEIMLGQGEKNIMTSLARNPEIFYKMREEVLTAIRRAG